MICVYKACGPMWALFPPHTILTVDSYWESSHCKSQRMFQVSSFKIGVDMQNTLKIKVRVPCPMNNKYTKLSC